MDPNLPNAPVSTVAPIIPVKKSFPLLPLILIILFLGASAATAFLYLQNQSLQSQLDSLTQLSAEPTPEASPTAGTPDPTANWKTFSNNMYLLKYPTGWELSTDKPMFIDTQGEVAIIPTQEINSIQAEVVFAVVPMVEKVARYSFSTQSDFDFWVRSPIGTNKEDSGGKITKIQDLIIDGFKSVQLAVLPPAGGSDVYFSNVTWVRKDNKNYYLELGGVVNQKVEKYLDQYNQILSTFKFTDDNDTQSNITVDTLTFTPPSGWQIKQDQYGYVLNFDDGRIGIGSGDNPKNLSIPDYVAEAAKEGPTPNFYSTSAEKISVSGITGYYIKNNNCEPTLCDTFALSYKSKIYQLTNLYNKEIVDLTQREIFEKMIQSISLH